MRHVLLLFLPLAALAQCPTNQYVLDLNEPVCTSTRPTCGAGEYETSAPTHTALLGCAVCADGTYSESSEAEQVCEDHSPACEPGRYQAIAPTTSNDRTCTLCPAGTFCPDSNSLAASPCPVNRFQPNAGAVGCLAVTACAASEWQKTAPTASTDRVCEPVTSCRWPEVETVSATATSDRACAVLNATATTTVPGKSKSKGLSDSAIAGVILACLVAVILTGVLGYVCFAKQNTPTHRTVASYKRRLKTFSVGDSDGDEVVIGGITVKAS